MPDWLTTPILQLSSLLRPQLGTLAMMLLATLMVIYGDALNRALKRRICKYPFLLRVGIFVLVCAFGYGGLLAIGSPFLAAQLATLPGLWLAPVLLLAFLIIGLLAERQKQL